MKPVSGVLGIEIVASKVTVFHEGRLSRSVIVEAIGKSGLAVLDGKERGAWLNDDGRPIFILIPVANPTGLVANGVSGVDAGQSHPGLVCSPDPAKSPPLDVFENLFRESL